LKREYNVLGVGEWDTTSGSVQILRLKGRKEERKKQHI